MAFFSLVYDTFRSVKVVFSAVATKDPLAGLGESAKFHRVDVGSFAVSFMRAAHLLDSARETL